MTRRHSRVFARTALIGAVLGSLVTIPQTGTAQSPTEPEILREQVWVESSVDSDQDGALDRIQVDIARPLVDRPVPVLLQLTTAVGAPGDDLDAEDADTGPTLLTAEAERWLAAGYAVVTAHAPGLAASQGCSDRGGPVDTAAAVATIDYLTGRVPGFREPEADNGFGVLWSSGKVALFSQAGSGLGLSVAATGVSGLAAVVAVDALVDGYAAHRSAGLTIAPVPTAEELAAAEAAAVEAAAVATEPQAGCDTATLAEAADAASGDRSEFWDQRQPLADAARFAAPVLFLQQGDAPGRSTARTGTAALIATAEAAGLAHQVRVLHGGVVSGLELPHHPDNDLTPVTAVLEWLEVELGPFTRSRTEDRPALVVEELVELAPVGNAPAQFEVRTSTPAEYAVGEPVALTTRATGALTTGPATPGPELRFAANNTVPVSDTARAGIPSGGLNFDTGVLGTELTLAGAPVLTARIALDGDVTAAQVPVTATLVLHPAEGAATEVARGWADLRNHADERESAELTPGVPVELTLRLPEINLTVPAGARLTLLVNGADGEFTPAGPDGALTFAIDSRFDLPVLGGPAAWAAAVAAPYVPGQEDQAPSTEEPGTENPGTGTGGTEEPAPTTEAPTTEAPSTEDPGTAPPVDPGTDPADPDTDPVEGPADPGAGPGTDPAEEPTAEPETCLPAADPAETDPTAGDPTAGDPTETEPTETEPTETEPIGTDPSQADPSQADPTEGEPAEGEPAQADPEQESAGESTGPNAGLEENTEETPLSYGPAIPTRPVVNGRTLAFASLPEFTGTDPAETTPEEFLGDGVVEVPAEDGAPATDTGEDTELGDGVQAGEDGLDCVLPVGEEPAAPEQTLPEPTPAPGPDTSPAPQVIQVRPGLTMVVVGDPTVELPPATLTGSDQVVSGHLGTVRIQDTRDLPGNWNLTGQVSDFVGPNGAVIVADNLGWAPNASGSARPGPAIAPGTPAGLSTYRVLCSTGAGVGGAVDCGGTLSFGIPASAAPGDYTATLTLTLI